MRGESDGIDHGEKHRQGDHVPGSVLQSKRNDQGLADEVEQGTSGYQTRHQADVAEGGDG